jgi:hypothetical protein
MFYNQSEKQREVLEEVKGYFRYADSHPMILSWRKKAIEDFGFYDGTKQWPEHVLEILRNRGQEAIVVNKIKNLVNYVSGIEIQTRFRIAFRDNSGRDEKLAKALTHLGYHVQTYNKMPHKASQKFRDALITGIGWSNLYKNGDDILYEYVNPFNVLFDPDDLTPELLEMNFVIRLRWISIMQAKQLWPKHKEYFNSLFSPASQYSSAGSVDGELSMRLQGFTDVYACGNGGTSSRILIVEVQYKKPKKAYSGLDLKGNYFKTFNEEEAEELSSDIEEINSYQIMRSIFTGDILLEHAPLIPSLPDLPDFTYIPSIWTRRFEDGVPDGWISVMKDLQRESNYRRTRLVHNLNSFRVEADINAFPGMSIEAIRSEVSRCDSVLLKTPGQGLKIESNMSLAQGQFEMLQRTDQELQQVSGIYDDALGKPTNATSGIAIQNRQINSVRNQVFAFDNLRSMKEREGQMLLNLLQGGGSEFLLAQILTEEEQETIILNIVREVGGKKHVFNDVRSIPLSVYVEEVPDFESSIEEKRASLQTILSNANAQLIMQSPSIMKLLGFRDWEEIAQEMQQLQQQQTMRNPQQQSQQPQQMLNPLQPQSNVIQ